MYIFSLLLFLYLVTIAYFCWGFTQIKNYENTQLPPKTKFTIIVPFRNEAKNLPTLLNSISKLNYPTTLFEVLLVDDQSEDNFIVPQTNFSIQIIPNQRQSNSPKKDAITTALKKCQTPWVITTDADCIVPPNWLLAYDNCIQEKKVEMIAGPVTYSHPKNFLESFQQLDLSSLQAATIASFGLQKGFMCNGANFAYTKNLFHTLNGFEGNQKIASGDDVFLLQKTIAEYPSKVIYLKSTQSIISTKPLESWRDLFYQRVRWAAKTTSYQSSFAKIIGYIVFLGNCSAIYFIWNSIWNQPLFLILFASKISIDLILLQQANRFLGVKQKKDLITASLLYPFWAVTVALYSLIGNYKWKGRTFKA